MTVHDHVDLAAEVMRRLDQQDQRIEELQRQLYDVQAMANRILLAAGMLSRAASEVIDPE